jgi:Fe-Mn family superoxide dismutase
MLTRRDALKAAAGSAAVLLVPAVARPVQSGSGFTLPKLPYPVDALEPYIDAKTMEIHHGRHHQAYVDNLNNALKDHPQWLNKRIEEIISNLKDLPDDKQMAVRNNGGGHYNHSLFWLMMKKNGGEPTGELRKAMEAAFGSVDAFKKTFKTAALGQFGSGWAWLVPGGEKGLRIITSANQDNPIMIGEPAPILGIDVWEHAYYLKYQNRRGDYVDAWFNVVNWDQVAENYAAAKK